MSAFVADSILVVHFVFVAFVVGGLALVWVGAWFGWPWVRNWWFRAAHLTAIVFVAAETLAGMTCPLTVWEDALRDRALDSGFIERWLHKVLYYDFPAWVFAVVYVLFAAIVAATWYWVRPLPRTR